MVAIYYLAVMKKQSPKPVVLCSASDLSSFNFFQKSSAKEFMRFSSIMLATRTEPGMKVSVKEQNYVCHAYVRPDKLCAVAVTDEDYPTATAHACLTYLLRDFTSSVPANVWAAADDAIDYKMIKDILTMFADPAKQPPSVAKVQRELDETTITLHNTLQSILKRGENLDELVDKTEELSTQAKAFYKTAKKTNCCGSI